MVGFGSILGASVLVALVIYLIAQISFVPIIGDLVEEVMGTIESAQTTNGEDPDQSFVDQYNETKKEIEQEEKSE